MDRHRVEEIVTEILKEWETKSDKKELPLDIPVEVSARHVHLTKEAVRQLFGPAACLTPKRPLSQPGQFLCEQRVTLVTAKGSIEQVAVLGPTREAVQVELSMTDCRKLGIQAPIRPSGDLRGAADVYIVGSNGMIESKGSVIVAQAHIHFPVQDAERLNIQNGQKVSVTLRNKRCITMEPVVCRVSNEAALTMHIDTDEANACMLSGNIVVRAKLCTPESIAMVDDIGIFDKSDTVQYLQNTGCNRAKEKLITENVARHLVTERQKQIVVEKGMILTPLAKDVLNSAGVEIVWRRGR